MYNALFLPFFAPAVKTCSSLDPPEYGSVEVVGYNAYYHCDKGYKLYGDKYITCRHGEWIGSIPICKRKSDKPRIFYLNAPACMHFYSVVENK